MMRRTSVASLPLMAAVTAVTSPTDTTPTTVYAHAACVVSRIAAVFYVSVSVLIRVRLRNTG